MAERRPKLRIREFLRHTLMDKLKQKPRFARQRLQTRLFFILFRLVIMVFQEDIVMFIKKVISLLIAASMVILPGIALADDDVEVVDSIMLDGEAEYDVPLESAPSLDAISAANSSAALLANHYSVSYVLNYTYSGGQTYTSESMRTALVATDGVPAALREHGRAGHSTRRREPLSDIPQWRERREHAALTTT